MAVLFIIISLLPIVLSLCNYPLLLLQNQKTVLMWAVEKGREIAMKKAVENRVYLDAVDNDGWTAVMYAARRGNIEILQYLLVFGASLTQATKEDEYTALHLAAGNELTEVCIILIKAGANPYAKDSSGRTPLEYIIVPKDKEKIQETISNTYKEDMTYELIHTLRIEAATDKSASLMLGHYS